jgi:MFS family permease
MLRNRNVLVLGFASLLNDVASEMVMPLLPVFLVTALGGAASWVGLIEGAADLVSSVLKWAVGVASDRTGRTKPFVVVGYALAAVSRPFLSLATAPWHVLAVRLSDRVGKGLRTAPRDALLGASVPPEQRGAAFGFHQSMDHAGSAIGPALALAMLLFWTQDLRTIFLVAAVPGILAGLVVPIAREVPRGASAGPSTGIGPELWRFLVPVAVVSFGTASDAFLMLEAGVTEHAPLEALPVISVLLHLIRTASATPGGWLADRVDPRWVVATGWAWRAAIYALLALTTDAWIAAALVVVYGFSGVTEGAEKKLVATYVGTRKSGAAFGIYHGVVGAVALPSGLLMGWLWDAYSPAAAWTMAASVVGAAVVLLLVTVRPASTPA